MAKTININNGSGTSQLINDDYTVSANVTGYENSTINPTNVSIIEGTNNYDFTIAANGTLTLHVTEDGTDSGVAVTGASFIRTDSTGNEYGLAIISDDNGNAVFNNVPYATSDAPLIYYKQTSSDGNHEFDTTIKSTSLATQTQTIQIQNSPGEQRTIKLTDSNYTNLPIENAQLTLTNE